VPPDSRKRASFRRNGIRIPPSEARFGNRLPQMLFVSSMQIHSARAYELIADATSSAASAVHRCRRGQAIYEAWTFFGFEYEGKHYSADVACTGEEFVLLELLDRIMSIAGRTNIRARFSTGCAAPGLLDDIHGLVFRAATKPLR